VQFYKNEGFESLPRTETSALLVVIMLDTMLTFLILFRSCSTLCKSVIMFLMTALSEMMLWVNVAMA